MAAGLMILAMVLLSTTVHAAAFTLTVNGGSGGGVHEQGTDVRFNGVSAAFQTISSTHVNATVPAGAGTGLIELVAYAGSSTSADDFVVVQAPPVITSFSPTTVAVGYVVTIIGENFTNAELVGFRPYVYGAFTVISDTQIQVTVPAGARTSKLGVQTRAGTVISASRIKVP